MFEFEDEEWRDIPNYPDYQISTRGRLYSKLRDTIMHGDNHNGVTLYNATGHKGWSIQVLMGCVFLGNDMNDPCRNRVLFKDRDSSNLMLDNLYIEDTSDLEGEVWMPVRYAANRELKDFYQVSNMGRIKSVKHYVEVRNHSKITQKPCPELIISAVPDNDGYCFAYLACKNGSDVNAQIHRLVATAFCPNDDPENKVQVNHIDRNTSNNKASNLEWCTPSENSLHAIRTGLKGNWTGRKLRYTVLHVEGDKIYNSLSDVDRAMGRSIGYCSEQLDHGRAVTDKDGNVWTLEVFKDIHRKIHNAGQRCTIDEFPGREFISLSEASLAIGRWEGYISDSLKRGSEIRNKGGDLMHVHLIGDAPVVAPNEVYKQKKEAGLIRPKKERKTSEWSPKKALKHVETGDVYPSMAAATRAMGRKDGYVNECFAYDRDCIDANGVKWTFEFVDKAIPIHYKKCPCYIDEIPGKIFANKSEASLAIGRQKDYISDRLHNNKPILDINEQEIHFHLA